MSECLESFIPLINVCLRFADHCVVDYLACFTDKCTAGTYIQSGVQSAVFHASVLCHKFCGTVFTAVPYIFPILFSTSLYIVTNAGI